MAIGNTEPEEKRQSQNEETKQPYIRPAFRFERVFVTTALACNKINPTEFICRPGSAS